MQKITLVIPCYNEAKRIPLMVEELRKFDQAWGKPYELIVVNDGSQDNTLELLDWDVKAISPNASRYQIIDSPANEGKGNALRLGLEASTGDFVLTLDADMATSPLELINWQQAQEGGLFSKEKILIGSRLHQQSKVKALWIRRFAGGVYNTAIRLFTPVVEKDTQCGFKLYPGDSGRLLFSGLQVKGWAHDIEILYKAHLHGLIIKSMPVNWKHVDNEKISVFKDGLIMFFHTIYISCRIKIDWYIFRKRTKVNTTQVKEKG